MSNGLNDYAANTEMRIGLRKEFPPQLVSKLPATPKRPALDYVSHAAVTDRLNKEAPGWTFELERFIEFTDDKGLPHIMAVYGYMQIGSVRRYEVGEADGLDNYGRELKGAISDFIRRAAMRFGVALDLWSKEALIEEESSPPSEARSAASAPPLGSRAATGTGVAPGEETPVPTASEAGAAKATTGDAADVPASASGTVAASVDAAASGQGALETSALADGEAAASMGESTLPAPQDFELGDPDAKASTDQFERLLTVCGGNKNKAQLRLNRCTGQHFTWESAQEEATRREVAAAITGEKLEGVA